MKRKVSVCAGVMAAMVAVAARAEEPQSPAAPVEAPAQTQGPAPVEAPTPAPAPTPVEAPAPTPAPTSVPASVERAPAVADASVRKEAPEAEVHIPFNFAVVPGVSTNGVTDHNVVNNMSLGLLVTQSGRLDGMALALVGNWADRTVSGAQLATAFNFAGGHVSGAQLSVGVNVAGGGLHGTQMSAGANVLRGDLEGAQLTTGVNVTSGNTRGLQASAGLNVASADLVGAQLTSGVNIARGSVRGLQGSAGVNIAASGMVGLQASAGVSYAGNIEGAQLSVINVGGDVNGAQVGLINVAHRAKGLQLGLINVAAESEGAPIGLVSIIGNGQAHAQLWASDLALTNVALKLGGEYVHTLYALGFQPGTDGAQRRFLAELGLGGHIPLEHFFIDIDALGGSIHGRRLWSDPQGLVGQLRLVVGLQLARHLSVIGGVTGNTLITFHGETWDELGVGRDLEWRHKDGDTLVRVWPGAMLGLQL